MSPDWAEKPEAVPYSSLSSPQTLNLYGYVGNNPLRQADVDGHLYNGAAESVGGIDGCTANSGSCEHGIKSVDDRLTPPSSIDVLGTDISIKYGDDMNLEQQLDTGAALESGAAAVNKGANELTPEDIAATKQMTSVELNGSLDIFMGQTGDHTMTLSFGYLESDTRPGYVGSLFGHEGQHVFNMGKFSGPERWKDEQSATDRQLSIGRKIGMIPWDQDWLTDYRNDPKRMQSHMENGLKGKDIK